MNDYVVFDVETQKSPDEVPGGWDNVYEMNMSCAAAWASDTNRFYLFGHTDEEKIRLCEFLNKKNVVTFNGITFDSRVLLGNDRKIHDDGTTSNQKYEWKNQDIYLAMWKKILAFNGSVPELIKEIEKQKFSKGVFNLDSIIWATLKTRKLSNGVEAIKMFKEGKIWQLHEYVLQDCIVERDLFQFIRKFKYLVTGSFDIVQF